MNTVIKGTKTIAEYKRVREDMENLARANYARHKEAFEEWGEGEPVKAWFDFEGNFCIEYESGNRGSYSKSEQLPLFLLCGVPFRQGQGKRQEPPLTAFLTHQRRDTR